MLFTGNVQNETGCYVTAGSRRASDMDAESGIETGDSDSATASVTSSEYPAAAATLPMASIRRDNTTAVNVDAAVTPDMALFSDDVGEFIRRMMVQPPPSPISLDDCDVAIVPPPTDYILDLLSTADYSGYSVLPPLVELPEDEATQSYRCDLNHADRRPAPPLPSPRVNEFTERKPKTPISRNGVPTPDVAAEHHERKRDFDGISNRAQVSADGVAAVNQPVPAKRCVNTSVDNGINPVVDIAASRTLIEDTLMKRATATLPASPTDNKSSRFFNIPQLARRRFSSDTESSSRKKSANIWKRFLKRDHESGGLTSSTGFSWTLLPHHRKSMTLQSQSVAESTATFRRRPNDLSPTSTQSKIASLAAARARELCISLPSDFRHLTTTNVEQRPEQRGASGDEQLTTTDRREVNEDGVRSAGQKRDDNELDASSESDDDTTSPERLAVRAETKHNYRDERGRLFNAAIDPRINPRSNKSSSLACVSGFNDEKRNLPTNVRHMTTAVTPTADQSNNSPRIPLMNISATLPRIYKGSQPSSEDQSASNQLSSDQPSSQGLEVECQDDDLSEVTRSEYLQASATEAVRPSPAADIDLRLRRSMTEQPTSAPPPLFGLLNSTLTVERDEPQPQSKCFDTFRGALKPMRWSEDGPNTAGSEKLRRHSDGALTFARSQVFPDYVDVLPPSTDVTDVRPVSAPVAAPRSVSSITTRDKRRSEKPQKVKLHKS